jgi:hypothetical protein
MKARRAVWPLALMAGGFAAAAPPTPSDRGAWPEPAAAAVRAWGGAPAPAAPAVAPARRAAVKPPAAVPAAPPAAPPQAPAPAWRFIGRIAEGGNVRALLLTPQQLRVVAEQEALDGEWRVQRIGEQGVELLWLPGSQPVRLAWATP